MRCVNLFYTSSRGLGPHHPADSVTAREQDFQDVRGYEARCPCNENERL